MAENREDEVTRRLLAHLAENADVEVIREMAGAVLRGHVSLAEAMSSPAYAEALKPGIDGFTHWYDALSENERATAVQLSESALATDADS